jgi:Tfp pilus assembly protein FimT
MDQLAICAATLGWSQKGPTQIWLTGQNETEKFQIHFSSVKLRDFKVAEQYDHFRCQISQNQIVFRANCYTVWTWGSD